MDIEALQTELEMKSRQLILVEKKVTQFNITIEELHSCLVTCQDKLKTWAKKEMGEGVKNFTKVMTKVANSINN